MLTDILFSKIVNLLPNGRQPHTRKVLAGILIAATASDPVISVVQGPWHFPFKSETASPEFRKIDMTVQQRALEYVFLCSLCAYKSQKCELSDVHFIGVFDLMFSSYTVYISLACIPQLLNYLSVHIFGFFFYRSFPYF